MRWSFTGQGNHFYLICFCLLAACSLWATADETRSVKSLIDQLENGESVELRAEAVRELGLIGDERAVEPLRVLLEDEDAVVRENAALALIRIDRDGSLEPLIAWAVGEMRTVYLDEAAGSAPETSAKGAVSPLNVVFDAIVTLSAAHQKEADQTRTLRMLASTLTMTDNYLAANELLARSLESVPKITDSAQRSEALGPLLQNIFRLYIRSGHLRNALTVLRMVDNPTAEVNELLLMSHICEEAGDCGLILPVLIQAAERAGSDLDDRKRDTIRYVEVRAHAAEGAYERALELARTISEPARRVRILTELAERLSEADQQAQSRAVLEEALASAGVPDGGEDEPWPSRAAIAGAYIKIGDLESAGQLLDSTEPSLGKIFITGELGLKVLQTGDEPRAREYFDKAVTGALELEESRERTKALLSMTEKQIQAGFQDQAAVTLDHVRAAAAVEGKEQWGMPSFGSANTVREVALLHAKAGDFDKALEVAQNVKTFSGMRARTLAELSLLQEEHGYVEEAEKLRNRAIEEAKTGTRMGMAELDAQSRSMALANMARIFGAGNHQELAQDLMFEALQAAQGISRPSSLIIQLEQIARSYSETGLVPDARAITVIEKIVKKAVPEEETEGK